jgi:hypothetical protein
MQEILRGSSRKRDDIGSGCDCRLLQEENAMRKSIMFGIALGLSLLTAASAFAQLAEKKVITLAAAHKTIR